VAIRALELQNPGAKDADAVLHDQTESASPALMQAEAFLGPTMRTCLGVTRLLSLFNLSRVVLDFLFGCHTMNYVFSDGGRAVIDDAVRCAPFFVSPHLQTLAIASTPKSGAGSDFDKSGGGVQEGGRAAGWKRESHRREAGGGRATGAGGGRATGWRRESRRLEARMPEGWEPESGMPQDATAGLPSHLM
jgi:hypothetical protein